MMKWFCFLLFLAVESRCEEDGEALNITSPCTDSNHIVLYPGVLAAGATNRICISRPNSGPAQGRLRAGVTPEGVVERELPAGDGGCVDISAPMAPNTEADLFVEMHYPGAQCSWKKSMRVRIAGGRVVVVHTEKARYRPGDLLRVRVLGLRADLTPAHGFIEESWLEAPSGAWEGARAATWRHVRTRLGVAQFQYELDEHAPVGQWTVRVRLGDGSQGSAAFWVGNYELPPFQLSVRHPAKVLSTSERLVWSVCVRYPWTEAVEGMLVIRIRGSGSTSTSPGIRTAVRLRAPKACHHHAAAARRIGLTGDNPPRVVIADFSFQEEGTGIWQNTTVVTQIVDKPVTLEFLTRHDAVISPGMPYKLKIKATLWDDLPANNERIQVCRAPTNQTQDLVLTKMTESCAETVTDDMGIAKVIFSADDGDWGYYRFQAQYQNNTAVTTSIVLPVLRSGSVHASLGSLKTDPRSGRTFVPLYLNLRSFSRPISAHFVVVTRGGTIYRWGATTQCPFSNSVNQIQTISRNTQCNSNLHQPTDTNSLYSRNGISLNESDALLDNDLLRVMLPIKLSPQMCPESQLVAYFIHNGELVSASKHFEMDECFSNKVDLSWESRKTPPGSTINLHITTPGPALCALTALDSATKLVKPRDTVKDIILRGLKRLIDGQKNLTLYDAAGECYLTAESQAPTSQSELMVTQLAAAGLRMAGGANSTRSCQAPAPLMAQDLLVPRSDFSEAWLWRLSLVGANGSTVMTARAPDSITRYEALAVCVSRTGIAVSSPAVLQVFREFFIHADSPKRLRRGDTTIIRYRLFNYLYEPLSVQVQIITDNHLEALMDNIETVCISSRSSIARRIELRARTAGNARVNVRAKSVTDANCGKNVGRSEVSDEIIIQMKIDHEGVPIQEYKSILLCENDNQDTGPSEVSWSWPGARSVPGSEAITVWTIAGVVGPLLADADDLVLLPRGCGEQNMARLATNLLALQLLDPKAFSVATAKEHVARGFTRQLQYQHPSGGFSAFGAADGAPSTWLTAFAVRYLRRVHQTLSPELPAPPALGRAERWLLEQQMENGCFRNDGQVFHRELSIERGGITEDSEVAIIALAAYVVTSLVEANMTLPVRVIDKSLDCLRAIPPMKSRNPARVYAYSLLAYAFIRLRHYEDELRKTNEANLQRWEGLHQDEELRILVELLGMARRDRDLVWWETGSLPTSIEATSHAVLALSLCPPALAESCAYDARAAVRWLSLHRNAAGGFVATQDTLKALEAITTWSSIQPSPQTNLTVTVRTNAKESKVNVRSGITVPEVMTLGEGTKVSVHVEGTGCALVQATRSYNTLYPEESQEKQLTVKVSVHTDGPFNCDANSTTCFCAAVVETCVLWSGDFPEMALLEISLPGGFGVDGAMLYSQLQPSNTLLRRIELPPSSNRATLYLGTRDGSSVGRGHHCYNVHAVGPRAKTKSAYVKILDYYNPEVNDTQMYTIPEDCPPRISDETNKYTKYDNLFIKAKSEDSGELIITNEYTINDIPDGIIPLEDPLHDNLVKEKDHTKYNKTEKSDNQNKVVETDSIEDNTRDERKPVLNQKEVTKIDKNEFQIIKNEFSSKTNQNDNHVADTKRRITKIDDKIELQEYLQHSEENTVHTEAKRSSEENSFTNRRGKELELPVKENIEITTTEPTTATVRTVELKISEKHKPQETKEHTERPTQNKEVDNPNLSDFHVIDSDKDLDVPSGVEGPVPSVVLPPPYHARGYMRMPYTGDPHVVPWPWTKPGPDRRSYEQQYTTPLYYYQPMPNGYNILYRVYN